MQIKSIFHVTWNAQYTTSRSRKTLVGTEGVQSPINSLPPTFFFFFYVCLFGKCQNHWVWSREGHINVCKRASFLAFQSSLRYHNHLPQQLSGGSDRAILSICPLYRKPHGTEITDFANGDQEDMSYISLVARLAIESDDSQILMLKDTPLWLWKYLWWTLLRVYNVIFNNCSFYFSPNLKRWASSCF